MQGPKKKLHRLKSKQSIFVGTKNILRTKNMFKSKKLTGKGIPVTVFHS